MPESRGGGTSGGDGSSSSVWVERGHNSSWMMEGAEVEEEEDVSSGNNPDIPEVDLRKQKKQQMSD